MLPIATEASGTTPYDGPLPPNCSVDHGDPAPRRAETPDPHSGALLLRSGKRNRLLASSTRLVAEQVAPRVAQQWRAVRIDWRVVVPSRALVRRVGSVVSQRRPEVGVDDVRPTVRRVIQLRDDRIPELPYEGS